MEEEIKKEFERLRGVISAKGVAFTGEMLTNQAEFYDRRAAIHTDGNTHYTNWINEHPNLIEAVQAANHFYHDTLRGLIGGKETSYLDVGCGDGDRTSAFIKGLKKYCQPTSCMAVDISPKMVEVARRILVLGNVIVGDLCDLRLGNEFDLVSCMYGVIGHIPKTSLDAALSSLHRTVKENGYVCLDFIGRDIATFRTWGYTLDDEGKGREFIAYHIGLNGRSISDDNGNSIVGTIRVFDPEQMKENLRHHGFVVIAQRRILPFYKDKTDFGTVYALVLGKL